jgi:Zn-finger nucleic acid-binding protein
MVRINYKRSSGVIIDRCKEHGYWLDSGELRQIMEWAKLEGIRDFTPVDDYPDSTSFSLVSSASMRSHRSLPEFDPVLSFFRKLYGF